MEHNTSAETDILVKYAAMIHEKNRVVNLTGFKTLQDIHDKLIVTSIINLDDFSVPRGTLIGDLGTGSGIPGMVLALLYPAYNFFLIEASEKKCAFLESVVTTLSVDNVELYNGRAEDVVCKKRNMCQLVVSRAFGPIYYSIEFGLSLLKRYGYLYIYSRKVYDDLSDEMILFCNELGGTGGRLTLSEGIAIQKVNHTPEVFPRSFPVMKRESKKLNEFRQR